jgi:hypothetical protein
MVGKEGSFEVCSERERKAARAGQGPALSGQRQNRKREIFQKKTLKKIKNLVVEPITCKKE